MRKRVHIALAVVAVAIVSVAVWQVLCEREPFKRGWIVLSYRQSLIPQSLVPLRPRSDFVYRGMSALGFYTLGSAAKPAVPALMRLLDNENRDVRADAARTLGYMRSVARFRGWSNACAAKIPRLAWLPPRPSRESTPKPPPKRA